MLLSDYRNETGNSLICKTPAILTGVLVHSSDATGAVTVYNGQDSNSGSKVGDFASPTPISFMHNLVHPVICPNGIYVTVTDTVADYTIFFAPLPKELA